VRLHGGLVLAELTARFGEQARAKVLAGEVVDADGAAIGEATTLPTGSSVYLYRDLPDEVPVPFDIPVLHQDADIVVVDKPHFLATMPRGRHVAQTALVRLRRDLGLPELSPAHRLDRGAVAKTYFARAAVDPALMLPRIVRTRIIKRRGHLQAVCEPGAPNAETLVELFSPDGLYRLTPRTGRTHQLRVQMAALGIPIIGDPLYPNVVDVPADEFSTPLRLLAQRIAFDDPFTGFRREFISRHGQ